MEKEKVTEELVRQNGNQAAAVMADYAGQGGGGGSASGIPTIDKNTQPNIVERDATAEDKAKFITSPIVRVVDLPNGKVPLFMIVSRPIDPEDPTSGSDTIAIPMKHMTSPTEDEDGQVSYSFGNSTTIFYISKDWSLLGVQGMA